MLHKKKNLLSCFVSFLLFFSLNAIQAENNPIVKSLGPETEPSLYLLTVERGYGLEYMWAWWGHSALLLRDTQKNLDLVFDFGIFDGDADFLFKYLKGMPVFQLGIDTLGQTIRRYENQNRTLYAQKIIGNQNQISELYQKLLIFSLPQNRYYHYHHFDKNCTTIIRDLLDENIFNRELSNKYTSRISTETKLSKAVRPALESPLIYTLFNAMAGIKIIKNKSIWLDDYLPNDLKKMLGAEPEEKVGKVFILYKAKQRQTDMDALFQSWLLFMLIGSLLFYLLYVFPITTTKIKYSKILGLLGWFLYMFTMGFLGLLAWFIYFYTSEDAFGYKTLGYIATFHLIQPFTLLLIILRIFKFHTRKPKTWSHIHALFLFIGFLGMMVALFISIQEFLICLVLAGALFSLYRQTLKHS